MATDFVIALHWLFNVKFLILKCSNPCLAFDSIILAQMFSRHLKVFARDKRHSLKLFIETKQLLDSIAEF